MDVLLPAVATAERSARPCEWYPLRGDRRSAPRPGRRYVGRRGPRRPRARPRCAPAPVGSRLGELGLVELAVRAGRRMHGDGLDAPQGRGARRDGERVEERGRGVAIAQVEREHAAAGTQLRAARRPPADGWRDPGTVTDATSGRDSRKRARASALAQCRSMRTCSVSMPRRTRKALNGAAIAPASVSSGADLGDRAPRRPATGSRDHVRMAADPLGAGLDDEVRAELQRTAQVRRRERVVDDDRDAMPVRPLGELGQVGDDDRRVGDGLQIEHPGPGERRLDGVGGRWGRRRRSPRRSGRGRRSSAPRAAVDGARARRSGRRHSSRETSAPWIAAMPDAKLKPASAPSSSAMAAAMADAVGLSMRA